MQPIENPFTEVRPPPRRVRRPAATGPPGRLPLRDHAARRTRSGCTSTGGPAPSSARTPTWSPGTSGSCPAGPPTRRTSGMTGPVHSVIGFDAEDRPAPVHQRAADPVRGGGGAGHPQRDPDRHRSGDRPGARDRADPAARGGLSVVPPPPPRRGRSDRSLRPGRRRSTCTPTRSARMGSSSRRRSSPRPRPPGSGSWRSPTMTTSSAYRELTARGARRYRRA